MTTTLRYRIVDSPVGPLTLAGIDSALMHLRMVDQTHEPDRSSWLTADDHAFPEAVEQLAAYFAGELTEFDVELELMGTEFQRALAEAAGPRFLVGGQADDMAATDGTAAASADVEWIHAQDRRDDRCLASSGGMVAGAHQPTPLLLEQYGRCLGLAFQIIDDLLDVRGDEGATGKARGQGFAAGEADVPRPVRSGSQRPQGRTTCVGSMRNRARPLGPSVQGLDALAHYVLQRNG